MISRRHAEVVHSEGLWWIRDLGSRNGTMVDQKPVTRAPLPTRCDVKLYEAAPVLRIEVRAGSAAPTVTS
jgi:pSer/pThr/pTyr-binding forkhead associated (FHA) protein